MIRDLISMFLPQNLAVRFSLVARQDIKQLTPLADLPTPAVREETRFQLEDLRNFRLTNTTGLSDNTLKSIYECFDHLVKQENYDTHFRMENLHGFSAGKSDPHTRPARVVKKTLAEMGSLVDDLRDIKDSMTDSQVIEACLRWPELRLNQGVKLLTDDWHGRYYWQNGGGSHHMSVLCHTLKKSGKTWVHPVKVIRHTLNLSAFALLDGRVSIFLIDSNVISEYRFGYENLFEKMPFVGDTIDFNEDLGLSILDFPFHLSYSISDYTFAFIDHSRPHAATVKKQFDKLTEENKAISFEDFLSQIADLEKPDRWLFEVASTRESLIS